MKPIVLTFLQWKDANPDLVEDDSRNSCPECDGSRLIECFHCQQDMDCDLCEGTGRLDKKQSLFMMYSAQKLSDQKALQKYIETVGVNP